MKLSIIIPAYNEEIELPECLRTVHDAMAIIGKERSKPPTVGADNLSSEATEFGWELIVADNNSTDQTAAIAEAHGAKVVFEGINQIAKARNAGARIATGDWFLFIDADSRLHVDSVREMLEAIDTDRYGGGGCLVRMDDIPRWGRLGIFTWNTLSRMMKWAAGSFVFCRSDAFREMGGFDEKYYAAEELYFSSSLKKWSREQGLGFVILRRQPHASSSRKFRMYSNAEIFRLFARVVFSYGRTVTSRSALDFFYDGRR